jgi:glycerophosphoryl diester phosphodiesterase
VKTTSNVVVLFLAVATMLSAAPAANAADWPEWSIAFVAHRGGIVPGYPENTLAAYRQAIKHGAEAIEIDLRATKDGEIVILSGFTKNPSWLKRCTGSEDRCGPPPTTRRAKSWKSWSDSV